MKKDRNEITLYIFIIATVIIGALFIIFEHPSFVHPEKPSPPEDIAVVSIWDTGAVTVTTSVDCINSIDDDVILIADPDADFDEIAKQIMEMQDVGDE